MDKLRPYLSPILLVVGIVLLWMVITAVKGGATPSTPLAAGAGLLLFAAAGLGILEATAGRTSFWGIVAVAILAIITLAA